MTFREVFCMIKKFVMPFPNCSSALEGLNAVLKNYTNRRAKSLQEFLMLLRTIIEDESSKAHVNHPFPTKPEISSKVKNSGQDYFLNNAYKREDEFTYHFRPYNSAQPPEQQNV